MQVINDANDASVLMRLLCNSMHIQTTCTHIQFVEGFTKLQREARTFEKELRDMFEEGIKKETNTPKDYISETESENGTVRD